MKRSQFWAAARLGSRPPGSLRKAGREFCFFMGNNADHAPLSALSLESLHASLPGVGWDNSRER
jgi:hypothetical protein